MNEPRLIDLMKVAAIAPECPACLDIAFALGEIRVAAKFLEDRFVEADEDERDPQEVVRERLSELQQLRAAIAALLADAEPAK
jgi:hypothetical protein